jgi:homogentisate 1,2-dioxygenase
MESFKQSGIHTKQAHVKIPEGLFEEEHGRKGFFGRVSHLYHENPPVNWNNIDGELKPQALPPMSKIGLKQNEFQEILFNQDCHIHLATFSDSFKNFYRNADFDELFFIQEGEGVIETSYGPVPYTTGDYINIPRGTTYKLYLKVKTDILKVESNSEFEEPTRGLMGPNALYDQSAIFTPEARLGTEQNQTEYIVEIKRCGKLTKISYPFNPLDVKGWKGSVYPKKISIYDFCPVMSHRYHMPPSAHTTFVTNGFVICSFVERPLEDSKHGVLKVPFYHSNIDFDEVLFYHKGNFFSRDNIAPGALTFHPQGVHHGPHPKAFSAGNDKTYTDEYAVMIDTKKPLQPTKFFSESEDKNYWKSWMKK